MVAGIFGSVPERLGAEQVEIKAVLYLLASLHTYAHSILGLLWGWRKLAGILSRTSPASHTPPSQEDQGSLLLGMEDAAGASHSLGGTCWPEASFSWAFLMDLQ